jgi:hypothetical protein
MNRSMRIGSIAICALFLLPFLTQPVYATEPSITKVNGTLSEIDGLPVLRVWGTPEERGFAHGYLLADTIKAMVNSFLAEGPLGGSLEHYTKEMLPKLARMKIDPAYEAEMYGILAGIESRLGGPVEVEFLRRPLKYEDILAINCTGDVTRFACSSFAAWDEMTEDGHTIAGRTMEWPELSSLIDRQIVLVNAPSADGRTKGWVAITWPSYVGCITGMNSEGVTVATHDADGRPPSVTSRFTPSAWTFRRAVESAAADTAFEDIARVVRAEVSIVGENMMVSRPFANGQPAAAVIEFDGDLTTGQGVTVRLPLADLRYLVCTNHFVERGKPRPCLRYERLEGVLDRISGSQGKRHVTIDQAWKMLADLEVPDTIMYHSVVFEPNRRLMRVAFAKPGVDAPKCKHVTLDVTRLLAGDYPGGK